MTQDSLAGKGQFFNSARIIERPYVKKKLYTSNNIQKLIENGT